jgi:hypothetical protein
VNLAALEAGGVDFRVNDRDGESVRFRELTLVSLGDDWPLLVLDVEEQGA